MLVCIVSPIRARQVNAMITLKYNAAIPQLAYHKVTKNCVIESDKAWPDERRLSLLIQSRYREHQTIGNLTIVSVLPDSWLMLPFSVSCVLLFSKLFCRNTNPNTIQYNT